MISYNLSDLIFSCGVASVMVRYETELKFLNASGVVLKTLFGTATVMDLSELHNAVDKLSRNQDSVAHSLSQQVTYFKQLDDAVTFNQQAVAQLSTTLKGYALKIQDTFQEVATKLEWGAKQGEIAATIRKLGFVLTRLEASVD
jgi:tetrahydromethanopterin S-methyltransferase subunit B